MQYVKIIILSLLLWLVQSPTFAAQTLPFGMSTALTGPAQQLGKSMRAGVKTYFARINNAGGVNGYMLELIVYDDGYEPKNIAGNMKKLLDQQQVLAVVGNVGTPTGVVTALLTRQRKTLFFAPFSGAGLLRKQPPNRYTMHFRASYADETASTINGLLRIGIKPEEIAFFTQNDHYGKDGYNGAINALEAMGYQQARQLAHGLYTRNQQDIQTALDVILPAKPKALVMVGTYEACAAFIKAAKPSLPDTLFINVSFVGSQALLHALGEDAEGVVVTQVVPNFNADLPVIKAYRQDLQKYAPEEAPGFVSLEGYLAAKVLVAGLQKLNQKPIQETLINALESLENYDVGIGIPISYSRDDHKGLSKVWPTIIRNGRFEALDWASLKP